MARAGVDFVDEKTRRFTRMMGLDENFTRKQLRHAYMCGCRKLAPDKGGDEKKFRKLQEAYEYLSCRASRPNADIETTIQERNDHDNLLAAPQTGRRHKDVNAAYAAMHGDSGPRLRGHGDWLKADVPANLRAPEKISEARLNDTFERIAHSNGRGPLAVSTHVVQPMCAQTSVGFDIEDNCDDFTIGHLADLQRAYNGAL